MKGRLSDCPTCGRYISDADPHGCETSTGQRWCLAHLPREADPELYDSWQRHVADPPAMLLGLSRLEAVVLLQAIAEAVSSRHYWSKDVRLSTQLRSMHGADAGMLERIRDRIAQETQLPDTQPTTGGA